MSSSETRTPIPGTWKPKKASGRTVAGTRRRIWSRVLTIQASTTKVMTSGIQISSPVTKYFFIQQFTRASSSVARATAAAGVWLPVLSALAGSERGLALLPPLKSVAYQPLPLSWKPAAEICLA
jgi:hypothetical protein